MLIVVDAGRTLHLRVRVRVLLVCGVRGMCGVRGVRGGQLRGALLGVMRAALVDVHLALAELAQVLPHRTLLAQRTHVMASLVLMQLIQL